MYETLNPNALKAISTTTAYVDDNRAACQGREGSGTQRLPVCSNDTRWDLLWSGEASTFEAQPTIFAPSICPLAYFSNKIRIATCMVACYRYDASGNGIVSILLQCLWLA